MGSFVGTSANGGNVTALTTANSAAITWPTVQSGDLAILAWTFQNTATPTDPTSQAFTLFDQVDDGSCRSRLLYRICTGSESGTISGWSNSIQNRQTAVLFVVRGFVSFVGTNATEPGTSATHDCPSIGTGNGAANSDSVIVIGTDRAGLTTTATPPTGWSKRTTSEFGTGGSGGTYTGIADDGLTGQTMPVDPGVWTMQSGTTSVTRTLALRPAPTGTAAVTQAAQTPTASGVLGYSGTASLSQAAQTSTASGTFASSGVTGTAAVTQGSQTSSASGVLGYAGTTAVTQAAQNSSATGVLGYSGTLARTQAPQTSTASGTSATSVTGSAAVTQANQASTASGFLGYTGTAARTQANQTSTASGTFTPAGISGTLARTQANQTSTASGVLGYSGTSARTQANQTATAAGGLGYTGTLARTQAPNTAAASGTVLNPVIGTAAVVQASQTASAAGVLGYVGTGSPIQAGDTSAAVGLYFFPVIGTAAVVQEDQTSDAAGISFDRITQRPDQGVTTRPAGSAVQRPFVGVTERP